MENKKYIPGAKTTSGKTGEVVSEGGYGEGDASLTTGARRREMSQGDYSLILESLVKSDASESKLANYLSSKGIDDADVEILLAERKKKEHPKLQDMVLWLLECCNFQRQKNYLTDTVELA